MRYVSLLSAACLCGCNAPPPEVLPAPAPLTSAKPASESAKSGAHVLPAAPGLHKLYRISDRLISGSSPEGDAGFASLRAMGIRTIITVDGTKPDVEAARRAGMRYVHIPIGYDSVPQEAAWRIAKAVRDLPGPVYIHCHHGLHRGPAAGAVAWLCAEPNCTVEAAVEVMRRAGTDPQYAGLYASPAAVKRPTAADLDRLPADFPETAPISALADLMVAIDGRWDNLTAAREAGWKALAGNPDVSPAHEALMLRELLREAARLPAVAARPEDFRRRLADAERAAGELETALRVAEPNSAMAAFRMVGQECKACHTVHRNRRIVAPVASDR